MTSFADLDRRVSAGDWVRLAGPTPSIRAVGKVVDGDYDAADNALRAAHVDMGAREYWIPPSELARVLPDEEARLCEVADARGLLGDDARSQRLRRALADYREGRARFVRTPGLLDMLWNLSIHADPDHGSLQIAGLLDDAVSILSTKRSRDELLPAARRAPGHAEAATFRAQRAAEAALRAEVNRARQEAARAAEKRQAQAVEFDAQTPLGVVTPPAKTADGPLVACTCSAGWESNWVHADSCAQAEGWYAPPSALQALATPPDRLLPRPRLAIHAEVLPRVLSVLRLYALVSVADALKLPRATWTTEGHGTTAILASNPSLEVVLSALNKRQLMAACDAVGLSGDLPDDADGLRRLLLKLAAP